MSAPATVGCRQMVDMDEEAGPRHRANYILERGVWHVTCRTCGWAAKGPVRRQLASLFRFHLRDDQTEPLPPES